MVLIYCFRFRLSRIRVEEKRGVDLFRWLRSRKKIERRTVVETFQVRVTDGSVVVPGPVLQVIFTAFALTNNANYGFR